MLKRFLSILLLMAIVFVPATILYSSEMANRHYADTTMDVLNDYYQEFNHDTYADESCQCQTDITSKDELLDKYYSGFLK